MDAATIVTQTISQIGTDTDRATVLSLLNEAYGTQVARARWLREIISIATTTAGTADYALADNVVTLERLRAGAYEFDPVGIDQMWALGTAGGTWNGRSGVYSVDYSSTGSTSITLYPTPDESGVALTGLASVLPDALTDDTGSVPVTPVDSHGSLIDGTAALILLRIDERPDLAAPFQQRFDGVTEEIRRRKNSRVGTGRPAQMQVAGIHYDRWVA